jgi:hypothetical protein
MQKRRDHCGLLRLFASRSRSFRRPPFDGRGVPRAVQSRRNRGSAADSHPADPPATAVPETLCHPFATAKIVVWPATCSVRGGLIIAAGSDDATLCACGHRGERTGNRCDRDKGSKCFPHSRPSCVCMACGHATAAPSTMPKNSRRCMSPPAGHCIRSIECINRGWLRVACCKVLMSVEGVHFRTSKRPSARSALPLSTDVVTVVGTSAKRATGDISLTDTFGC